MCRRSRSWVTRASTVSPGTGSSARRSSPRPSCASSTRRSTRFLRRRAFATHSKPRRSRSCRWRQRSSAPTSPTRSRTGPKWRAPARSRRSDDVTLPRVSVSEQLAHAFGGMPDRLPPAVRVVCDAVLMDVAGLCVSARKSDYVQAALRASSEPGSCTVIGHQGAFNIATAALCNGTAAHGEDYDDTFEGGPVHAGAVIVPALLATAEHHRLAGGDALRGVAVGCEVMCRLCLVAPKRVHKAGFHPTAVFGALGAAAGVASALSLDETEWFNALGIAGSMASGIIEYLAEGAWTKRMHPGWAAQAGYRAARMAQAGFT